MRSPKLTVTIECGNAAFDGTHLIPELKRLLKHVAWRTGQALPPDFETFSESLYDANGNRVGEWSFDPGMKQEDAAPMDPSDPNYEPDSAPGTAFLGEPPRTRIVPGSEVTSASLAATDYVGSRGQTYPAKRKRKVKSRYLDPNAPLDTPSLDDSFHKGEMDV